MELKELFQNAVKELSGINDAKDFRLEQAEHLSNGGVWDLVVSYLLPRRDRAEQALPGFPTHERVYKRVRFDDEKRLLGLYIFQP